MQQRITHIIGSSALVLAAVLLAPLCGQAQQAEQPNRDQTTGTEQLENPNAQPAKDRGSEEAITREEYETLLKAFQEKNPGKTFQDLSKEEFENYITTELARLREQRAKAAETGKTDEGPDSR